MRENAKLKVALFGPLGDTKHFNTALYTCVVVCALLWPFSKFFAASLLVLFAWGLVSVFTIGAFGKQSLLAWQATPLPTRILVLLLSLLPVFPAMLMSSAPLTGIATFAVVTGIMGWVIRALFLHALNVHDKRSEKLQ